MNVARAAAFAIAFLVASNATAQTASDRAYVGFTVARATEIGARGTRLDDRQQLELRVPLPPIRAGRTFLLPSLGYETRWLGADLWLSASLGLDVMNDFAVLDEDRDPGRWPWSRPRGPRPTRA